MNATLSRHPHKNTLTPDHVAAYNAIREADGLISIKQISERLDIGNDSVVWQIIVDLLNEGMLIVTAKDKKRRIA